MPGPPFTSSAVGLDLSPRIASSTTVVGSPAAAVETIVCSVTTPAGISLASGVIVIGFGAFTVGANGVSVNLKIRRTDASGSTRAATGAVTYTAADLGALAVHAFDTSPADGQVYVLTATVASGTATSTFSAVQLTVIAV